MFQHVFSSKKCIKRDTTSKTLDAYSIYKKYFISASDKS